MMHVDAGRVEHVRSDEHYDAARISWWQWRERVFWHRTNRFCWPA
jgi:hypothetical protein